MQKQMTLVIECNIMRLDSSFQHKNFGSNKPDAKTASPIYDTWENNMNLIYPNMFGIPKKETSAFVFLQ